MPSWKRSFYAAWVAQVCSITGFCFILPFLPLYVRSLGVAKDEVPLWAGIVMAASALSMAVFAPLWGALADRLGRKPMVVRAMLGGSVALLLMALTRTVGQLVACRVLQGVLTGTLAASVALVASMAPRERSGYALGMIQSAAYVGLSVGPYLGGRVIDAYGFAAAFCVAGVLLAVGGVLVYLCVDERFTPSRSLDRERRGSFGQVFAAVGFLIAVFALLSLRFARTATGPVFPLFVEQIRGSSEGIASLTGEVVAVGGIAAAIAAWSFGHASDTWGPKRVLVTSSLVAGVLSLGYLFVTEVWQLFVLRALFAVAAAGLIPAANAMIRHATHDRNLGKAYGVTSSLTAIGWACGALVGGYMGQVVGLRAPFVLTGVMLGFTALLVAWRVRGGSPSATPASSAQRNRK